MFVTPEGLNKCTNKGCLKPYEEKENTEESCNYHPGDPCFRDMRKHWTCCNKETWDWDDFVKLPTCK